MVWILVLLFLAVLVYDLYREIKNQLFLQKRYPEYMRDRGKDLKVGQVWIHPPSGTTYMITTVFKNRVRYHVYSLPITGTRDRSLAFSSTATEEAFRKVINQSRLHLRMEYPANILAAQSQDITKPHIVVSRIAK